MVDTTRKLKIICIGSVEGQISKLTERLNSIHSSGKGPFDLVIICGNLFKLDDETENTILAKELMNNKFKFSIPTYFISGSVPFPKPIQNKLIQGESEICTNLYFLGKSGILTTTEGVKIAFLGGTLSNSINTLNTDSTTQYNKYCSSEIDTLVSKPVPDYIDLLITYDWPYNIDLLSEKYMKAVPANMPISTKEVQRLAQHYKPKYHFATSDGSNFFEREPYYSLKEDVEDEAKYLITRFISLDKIDNLDGKKYLYAFNIQLGPKLFTEPELPARTTKSPFLNSEIKNKRSMNQDQSSILQDNIAHKSKKSVPPDSYVCRICHQPGHFVVDCPSISNEGSKELNSKNKNQPPEGYICNRCKVPGHYIKNCPLPFEDNTQECWFCMSNPKLAKSLIVSIGNQLYTSIAKGSLIDPFSKDSLVPGGGNLILLPISHQYNLHYPNDELKDELTNELTAYKKALRDFFKKYKCQPVYFEITRPFTKQHAHIQVVPIPDNLVPKLKDAFETQARQSGHELKHNFKPKPDVPFLLVELPSGETMGYNLQKGAKVNFQFGRQVIAGLLNILDRVDWRACSFTPEQEEAMKNQFVEAFKEFNPFD